MSDPQAYCNGRWLPISELTIPFYDMGFVLGTTISEQLRTFSGELFRLEDHLKRLFRSLEIIQVDPGLTLAQLTQIAREAVTRNFPQVASGCDLGLGIFVTPGPYPTFAGDAEMRPLVCVYTYPLPFHRWADKYRQGDSILVSRIQQVPPESWPPELKCRSRMHYFLADQEAAAVRPRARAILLDRDGFVSEATTANLIMFRTGEGLISPPRNKILPGISLQVVSELASSLGIPMVHRDIRPDEFTTADEILLTSTTICLLPVLHCEGKAVADGKPGPIGQQLLSAWSDLVGIDIVAQAERFGGAGCA